MNSLPLPEQRRRYRIAVATAWINTIAFGSSALYALFCAHGALIAAWLGVCMILFSAGFRASFATYRYRAGRPVSVRSFIRQPSEWVPNPFGFPGPVVDVAAVDVSEPVTPARRRIK